MPHIFRNIPSYLKYVQTMNEAHRPMYTKSTDLMNFNCDFIINFGKRSLITSTAASTNKSGLLQLFRLDSRVVVAGNLSISHLSVMYNS